MGRVVHLEWSHKLCYRKASRKIFFKGTSGEQVRVPTPSVTKKVEKQCKSTCGMV